MSNAHGKHRQKGFTIIELLIATTVFSLVLLMATAGILQITRMYYRGVAQARVQETARTVVDELAESIRYGTGSLFVSSFAGGPEIAPGVTPNGGSFCIGSQRYSFAIDRQVSADPSADINDKQQHHGLWVDQPSAPSCAADVAAPLDVADPESDPVVGTGFVGRELLSENMRLTRLQLTPLGNATRIEVGVAYGDTDLLEPVGNYLQCRIGVPGSEFCAVSNLSVTVTQRLP